MSKPHNLANRTKELETFLEMATGSHDCRIMFIEGPSGIGKTSLVRRFKHKCPSEIKYVPFDCKGGNSLADFLSHVILYLGNEHFPNFSSKLKFFVHGGVDFSENDIAAETISIAIHADANSATQSFRLDQLQQAFFSDLGELEHRTVITLDTYQTASELLQNWIESKWLRAVECQLERVVTVIAGQSIPNPNNLVWGDKCEHFHLPAIKDVKAWYDFYSQKLSEDSIKTVALLCDGHPATVHQMLSLVESRW